MIAEAMAYIRGMARTAERIEDPGHLGAFVIHDQSTQCTALMSPQEAVSAHKFADVDSLAAWLLKHAKPGPTEVLVAATEIRASPDPARAGRTGVSAKLHPHPRAQRWFDAFKKGLSQRDLFRLLIVAEEDFPQLTLADGSPAGSGNFAHEVRKLSVKRDSAFAAELDHRGFYKVRDESASTELSARVPSEFEIVVPLLQGIRDASDVVMDAPEPHGALECTYTLRILLDIDMSMAAPQFTLSAPGLELAQHEALRDAAAWLRHLLGDEWLVGLGDYRTLELPMRRI